MALQKFLYNYESFSQRINTHLSHVNLQCIAYYGDPQNFWILTNAEVFYVCMYLKKFMVCKWYIDTVYSGDYNTTKIIGQKP